MQELNEDIAAMEQMEQYERCHILKDILDRFESISDEEVRRDNTNVEEDM
jgi:recombinational DNA repair protein RecR